MRQIRSLLLLNLCLVVLFAVTACSKQNSDSSGTAPVAVQEPTIKATVAEMDEPWQYPQARLLDIGRLVLYPPQIQTWPGFEDFEALMAVELHPRRWPQEVLYATVSVSGSTRLKLDDRLVIIANPKVDAVVFTAGGNAEYQRALRNGVENTRIEMPLDVFLLSLEDAVLNSSAAAKFSTAAPEILVRTAPTILLSIPGKPFRQPLENTGTELVLNANWPLIYERTSARWYLLYGDLWLATDQLDGSWSRVTTLPSRLSTLSPYGTHVELLAAIPPPQSETKLPQVAYRSTPTELVVIAGKPVLKPVAAAQGLEYVSNTDAALLRYDQRWYLLAAGRWFSSPGLAKNASWRHQSSLPAVFADIPVDHQLAWLRAAIAGTREARLETLEAQLPREIRISRGSNPGLRVLYDGQPRFQGITGTNLRRAVNTPQQVLLADDVYYLCQQAVWYSGASPQGPWVATGDIPQSIYQIPPSSPSFAVTDVKVASITSDDITYTSTSAYESGTYVADGVVVLSTGWYYPPYLASFYFPYYPAYGYGQHYNPNTGAFAQRSTWYGPYGGYSYGEAYNPTTGRYGFREVVGDDNDWASYSEVYSDTIKGEGGDLYAGHNGDVYKKTDAGWQQFDRDSRQWQQLPQGGSTATGAGQQAQRAPLEHDARARQLGYQRFENPRSSRAAVSPR
jgi:hypothetical protein